MGLGVFRNRFSAWENTAPHSADRYEAWGRSLLAMEGILVDFEVHYRGEQILLYGKP
jgi:hypothetical protein